MGGARSPRRARGAPSGGGSSAQRAQSCWMEMHMSIRILALSAFGAFIISGPLQHIGAIPQTAVGDASKATIKAAMNVGVKEAHACFGHGNGKGKGPRF
jgi:hypothetical protein